jgi:hypothetical protein
VQKTLILDATEVNFGEVAVGIRETRELYIVNRSAEVADLKMDLLPESRGFAVVNALRPLAPGEQKRLIV